jgi:excisionase family DNA binding protein
MTRRRLPIDPVLVSPSRRGGGTGEPASNPVPPFTEALLLDSREVSHLLGIGRTKAFEMMARGDLPVVRIGRCVRVPREALAAWVCNKTVDIDRFQSLRR